MERYYFIDKKIAVEEHRTVVVGVEDTFIENYQEHYNKLFKAVGQEAPEVIYYVGSYVYRVPVVENNTVREATGKDLVEIGIYTLQEGEILEGEDITTIPVPMNDNSYKWINNKWVVDEETTALKKERLVNREIDKYVALSEKKEKYLKYGFDVTAIENEMAGNIIRRNILLGENLSVQGVENNETN